MKKILNTLMITISIVLSCTKAYSFSDKDEQMLRKMGIKGAQILLHNDKWQIKPSKMDIDGLVYKGQTKSLIDWEGMDHTKWLDFNHWKDQREQRDKFPSWKIKFRETQHTELVGRVLKCVGKCKIYRGENSVNSQYQSRIMEGDELITQEHSYAWLILADGSIARISPKTSMTFNEFNISNKQAFYFIRLNHGHIHWQVRKTGEFEKKNLAETDLLFHPLMERAANREHHSRIEYQSMNENEKLVYLTRNNYGFNNQYDTLNSTLKKNDDYLSSVNTKVFMVTPNATYFAQNSHFDLYYSINSISAFRYKTELAGFEIKDNREVEVLAFLRGYNNKSEKVLTKGQWYSVNKDGSSISESELGKNFKSIKLFTKRIPTIHLAREIILKKSFPYLYEKKFTSKNLIQDYGYRLWDDNSTEDVKATETKRRLAFLKEYTRRVETTNLFSIKKVLRSKNIDTFNAEYYSLALNEQLKKLKNQYSSKRMIIPELREIEYYIWTLKYAENKK